MAENFLLRVISTEGVTQTYIVSGATKESLSIKAKAGSKYSIVADEKAVQTSGQIKPSGNTGKPKLKLNKLNDDLWMTSDDEVSQIRIENFYKEPNVSIGGDVLALEGQSTNLLSDANGNFVVEQVQSASFAVASVPVVATNTLMYGVAGVGALAAAGGGGGGGGSTTEDKTAPNKPNLVQGTGVSNGATRAEALAGVVSITAEAGSTLKVIFTDTNGRSIIKTFPATGVAQVVTLAASDLGTGTNQLGDGAITVKVVATDAAGNNSEEASSNFTLSTVAPKLSATVPPTISKTTLSGAAGDSAGETIALTATFDSAVEGLTGGTNNNVFKVGNRLVNATWSGTAGSKTRTLTYTIQPGDNGQASIDEDALRAALAVGLKDVAGNAFDSTALIANIDVGNNALPNVTTTGLNPPTLVQSTGASNGATKDEALAGVVSITAADGNTVKVTFTDANNRSVIKAFGATGVPQLVKLVEADFGTGPSQLGDGTITVKAEATDAAGNASNASESSFALDTLAPKLSATVAPVISKTTTTGTAGDSVGETIALTLTFDSIVDGLTTGINSTVFKVGTRLVNATWSGTAGSNTRTLTYTIQPGDNGQANIDEDALKAALVAGLKDTAGNGFDSTVLIANIDVGNNALPVVTTAVPTPPTLVQGSGVSNGATKDEALAGVVSVTAEDGSTVKVTFTDANNHSVIKTFTATGVAQLVKLVATDFGTGLGQLGDGAITIKAMATNAAGNSSNEATSTFTLDTKVDAAFIQLAASSDSGQSNSDGQTNVLKPTLSGTGEKGATVKIRDGSSTGAEVATATVGADGMWSATLAANLSEGVHHLYAIIEDAAGNVTTPTIGGKVLARSLGFEDGTKLGDPGVTIGGAFKATDITGVGVTVLNADGTFKSHNVYAIYSNTTAESDRVSGLLKTKLTETFATGEQVIITTNDEWATKMSAEAKAALANIGATRSIIDSAEFRSSYLMITKKTATGWAVDYEQYNPRLASNSLEAYADRDIHTVNIDTVGTTVQLASVAGVSDTNSRATKAEALAGVLNIKVDGGVDVNVTFKDQAGNSIVKTLKGDILTGNTVAQLIKLADADIGSGQGQLNDGVITVKAVAVADAAGNLGVESSRSFTLDTKVDAAFIQLAASSDSGQTNSDGQTNQQKPTLTGTGETGATVKIRDGSSTGTEVATATVGADGTWSATLAANLSEGVHHLYAIIEDAAGNIATPTLGGKVLARSLGLEDGTKLGSPGVTVGGAFKQTDAKGVGVTVLNADGTFKSHSDYSIYSEVAGESDRVSGLLKTKLTETFATGEQVIITTNDEWATKMSAEPKAALANIGATRSIVDNAEFRSSYLMITKKTANGWAVDYEQYNPRGASRSLEAYADSNIHTVNIDTSGTTLELTSVAGVSDANSRATRTEALEGVVNVKVAGGVDVNLTFRDEIGNSVFKTIRGSIFEGKDVPQLVKLTDADIGIGAGKLNDGVITVKAVAVADAAGNLGIESSRSFTLDTKVNAVNMNAPGVDGRLNIKTPILTGTGEVGATVKIRDGSNTGTEVATATVGADGTWSATVTTPLAEGVHQLYASIQDIAGNINLPLATGGLVAKSYSFQPAGSSLKGGVKIGNETKEVLRGVGVTVLGVDGSFKSHDTYDAYLEPVGTNNDSKSASLISKLASTNYVSGETVIITTNDDWFSGFTGACRTAMVNIGASSVLISAPVFRSAFLMITKKTDIGWKADYQDYQDYQEGVAQQPLVAYGDSNIQTVKVLAGASLVADSLSQAQSTTEFGTMDASLVYNGNTYVMAKNKLNHELLDANLGNDGGDTTVATTESTKTAVKGADTSYASVLRDGKTYVLLDKVELKEVLQQANTSLWDASTKLASGEGFWTANQTASNTHSYIADTTHQVYAGVDALEKWTVFKVL